MASRKTSVRLSETAQTLCHNLSIGGETNWTGSINAMAEQFELMLKDNLPTLSENEWNALYCVYNGYAPSDNQEQEARLLHWHISEGYQYDAQVREFLGSKENAIEFIERIKAWTLTQQFAVIYHARAFWQKGEANTAQFSE